MKHWDCLEFWRCQEWQDIQEQLDELERKGISYNPDRTNLFNALDLTPFDTCKVCIVGQDPYPQKKYCTGVAFSIPKTEPTWPKTLAYILKEYQEDIATAHHDRKNKHPYPIPKTGDLTPWCEQGVLLLNSIPTCQTGISLSHEHWKWNYLIQEIIEKLAAKPQGMVFAFLGSKARQYVQYVDPDSLVETEYRTTKQAVFGIYPEGTRNFCIITGHPSPRTQHLSHWSTSGKLFHTRIPFTPFLGSRLFTTINDYLVRLDYKPVDWRLP